MNVCDDTFGPRVTAALRRAAGIGGMVSFGKES